MTRAPSRTAVRACVVALLAGLLALLVSVAAPMARAAEDPSAAVPAPEATVAPQMRCPLATVACAAQNAGTVPASQPVQILDPTDPNLLSGVARDTAQAAGTVLSDTVGWWLRTPSLPVESEGVLALQATMLGLAGVVLTLLVIVQGIRMMMTRRGAPFAELVRGMIVASLVIVAGIALIDSALIASDRMADGIIGLAFPDSDALVQRMVQVMLGQGVTGQAPVLLLIFSLIVLSAGLLMAVLMFLRQAAIPMLGALLPIAAVGQAGPRGTQLWLPRLLNAVVAIVLYKPVVALILSLGFVQFSDDATLVDAIRGSVMLALSVAAFFVLLKVFAPAANAIAQRGGHGLAVLGPMVTSTFAPRGAGTPGDTTAVQHAAYMQGRGGRAVGPDVADGSAASVRAVHDGASGVTAPAVLNAPPAPAAPMAEVVAFPQGPVRGDADVRAPAPEQPAMTLRSVNGGAVDGGPGHAPTYGAPPYGQGQPREGTHHGR